MSDGFAGGSARAVRRATETLTEPPARGRTILKEVEQMRHDEEAPYAPGTRVELVDAREPEAQRAGVVLYVGSDANVLVGWDDESTSVLPHDSLLLPPAERTRQASSVEL